MINRLSFIYLGLKTINTSEFNEVEGPTGVMFFRNVISLLLFGFITYFIAFCIYYCIANVFL